MRKWALLIGLLISVTLVTAQEKIQFNSFNEVVQYGIENNPMLIAEAHQWEASKELPKKLGSIPDPAVGVRLNGIPAKDSQQDVDQKRYLLQQSFPFWGKLKHLKSLGNAQETAAYIDFLLAKNKFILLIETTVNDLFLNQEFRTIIAKRQASLTQLINIADVKYRAGQGLQANVLKAKVTEGKLKQERLSLDHERLMLTEKLKMLLDLDPVSTPLLQFTQSFVSNDLLSMPNQTQINQSLMVQKAEAVKAMGIARVSVNQDRFLPNFSAQLEIWDTPNSDQQYGGQLMMTIPWISAKNSASLAQSKKELKAKELTLEDVQNMMRSRLTTLVSGINTTQEMISLYQDHLLKDARLSFLNFQKSFEVDQVSFIDYFESEQTLFNLEKQYERLKKQYFVQLATLRYEFEKGGFPDE